MDENSKKDMEINNTFAQDQYITDSNQNTINNYIKTEKVTPKRVSQSLKTFIIFLFILLLIAIAVLLYFKEAKSTNLLSESPKLTEPSIELTDKTLSASTEENNSVMSSTSSEEKIDLSESDLDKLQDLISYYSYAINRVTNTNSDIVEKNTILVYIAMKYFDNKSIPKASLSTKVENSKKYIKSVDNVNKFLTELTGIPYENALETYNDFVTYSSFTNGYDYGQKSTYLESYTCTDVSIKKSNNDVLNAVAKVTRTLGNQKVEYELSINVVANENYTYVPFKITSMVAKNLSEDFDTTMHLTNLYDLTLENYNSVKTNIITYMNTKKINKMQDANYTITINSITDTDKGVYQMDITASYVDVEEEKISQEYIILVDKASLLVKSMTEK